jgi:hypothetical protein
MSQGTEKQWTPEQIAKALEGAMNPVVSINGKKVAEVALITAEATGNVITVKYFLKS